MFSFLSLLATLVILISNWCVLEPTIRIEILCKFGGTNYDESGAKIKEQRQIRGHNVPKIHFM